MILLKRAFLLLAIALYSLPIESTSYAVTKETPEKRVIEVDVYKTSVSLIKKYEGLRLKAYEDYSGCSI